MEHKQELAQSRCGCSGRMHTPDTQTDVPGTCLTWGDANEQVPSACVLHSLLQPMIHTLSGPALQNAPQLTPGASSLAASWCKVVLAQAGIHLHVSQLQHPGASQLEVCYRSGAYLQDCRLGSSHLAGSSVCSAGVTAADLSNVAAREQCCQPYLQVRLHREAELEMVSPAAYRDSKQQALATNRAVRARAQMHRARIA